MALIKCKECQSEISDKATSCPKCGAHVKKPTSVITIIFAIAILSIFITMCSSNESSKDGDKESTEKVASCSNDYTKCINNADMVNNYSGWFDAKYSCKEKFSEIVKYGKPEYKNGDSHAFSYFHEGEDYPKKAIGTLIAEASVPNVFGASVNGEQICVYDFETNKVIKQWGDFNDVNGFYESNDYEEIIKLREQKIIEKNDLAKSKSLSVKDNEEVGDKQNIHASQAASDAINNTLATNEDLVSQPIVPEAPAWCKNAKTNVENMICTSQKLMQTDNEMYVLYKKAEADAPDKKAFYADSRAWRVNVRDACDNEECLILAYQVRSEHMIEAGQK
jgi:uncharacterized protein YecT (DUF1311 family)/predicted nucleic acid-binding Zn ribbon protein